LVKFRGLLGEVLQGNVFYRTKWQAAGVDLAALATTPEPGQLPFTTKAELLADQAAYPPYGSNLTYPLAKYARMHQTSGSTGQPLRWLDTASSWDWLLACWRLIYDVVGLTDADRHFFPFSFGPFLGFWAAFEGATRLGRFCLPGGGMSSSARLRFIVDHHVTVVGCTPSYALKLAQTAQADGIDLARSAVRCLILAGEPGASISATRALLEQAWGARVFDHWGMTEIGSLGIECPENPGGFHVLGSECLVEVIDPATHAPVPAGTRGELVITNLGRWGSPLIRYRTGDVVVLDPNPCPCGRPWPRFAGGILGRVDDMLTVRGNNVYPSMIEAVVRRFPEIGEFQMVVTRAGPLDELELVLEVPPAAADVAGRVAQAIRDAHLFRPTVRCVPPGTLPATEMKARRLVHRSASD
jgi:phenylacetate-CoA ligase